MKGKGVFKMIGFVLAVAVAIPLAKIAVAFLLTLVASLGVMIAAAPMVMVPIVLAVGLFGFIDYLIIKWLIGLFK